jgi:hypothetical protein
MPFVSVISRRNKQLWPWRRSSIVLSFRATEFTLTGTRTQKNFLSFDHSKVSFWYQEIRIPSWGKLLDAFSSYKQTYIPTI